MILRELWQPRLSEGGNLEIGAGKADRIDSAKREQVVPILQKFIQALDNQFANDTGNPIWGNDVLASSKHLAGSSFHFFNRAQIADTDFARVKNTVGDIDLQIDRQKNNDVRQWLEKLPSGARVGPAEFVGSDGKDSEQVLTLWRFPGIVVTDSQGSETAITIQIDLEMKDYENGSPTDWAGFSTSSSWQDLSEGIKGVFHKFLIQSLSVLTKQEFVLQKMKKTRGKDEYTRGDRVETTDTIVSFAIKSKEGGGLRLKYEPLTDPDTGEPETENGKPVMIKRPTTGYEKDIVEIFYQLFDGRISRDALERNKKHLWSFIGIAKLAQASLTPKDRQQAVDSFAEKIFGKGAQGLYKGDPKKDREEKTVALDKLSEIMQTTPEDLDNMVDNYYANYK